MASISVASGQSRLQHTLQGVPYLNLLRQADLPLTGQDALLASATHATQKSAWVRRLAIELSLGKVKPRVLRLRSRNCVKSITSGLDGWHVTVLQSRGCLSTMCL